MPLARLTSGAPHDPSCTGCPCCSEDAASLLRMTPTEYAGVLRAASAASTAGKSPVFAAARVLRTTRRAAKPAAPKPTPKPTTTLPDPYRLAGKANTIRRDADGLPDTYAMVKGGAA